MDPLRLVSRQNTQSFHHNMSNQMECLFSLEKQTLTVKDVCAILNILVLNKSCKDALVYFMESIYTKFFETLLSSTPTQRIPSSNDLFMVEESILYLLSVYIKSYLDKPYMLLNFDIVFKYIKATEMHLLQICTSVPHHCALVEMIAMQCNVTANYNICRLTFEYAKKKPDQVIYNLLKDYFNIDTLENTPQNRKQPWIGYILDLFATNRSCDGCKSNKLLLQNQKAEHPEYCNTVEPFTQDEMNTIPPVLLSVLHDQGKCFGFHTLFMQEYIQRTAADSASLINIFTGAELENVNVWTMIVRKNFLNLWRLYKGNFKPCNC